MILFIFNYKKEVPWFSDKKLDRNKISERNTNWMGYLNDSTDIRKLSVPGTHDSAASEFVYNYFKLQWVNFYSQCQVWSIEEQLLAGIRYFDLRPAGDGEVYHGEHQTKYSFKQIFDIYKKFLIAHPTEGLFVRIQFQSKIWDNNLEESKKESIYKVLDNYTDYLFKDNYVPTIGQLRKKIYIFLEHLEYNNFLIWDNNTLIELQDYFKLFGIRKFELDKKKNLVKKYMFNKNKEKLIINHCSAVGRGVLTTLTYVAYTVNEVPFVENNYRGIFAFDFPSEELITHVINQNEEFFK
jgi:1-phosphatidylinositol phosphodiesterase